MCTGPFIKAHTLHALMLAAVLYMSCACAILSDFAFSVQKHTPTSYNVLLIEFQHVHFNSWKSS